MKNLITRTLSGIVYVALIVGAILNVEISVQVSFIPFAILFGLFVAAGMYEAIKIVSPAHEFKPADSIDILGGLILFLSVFLGLDSLTYLLTLPLAYFVLRLVIQLYAPKVNAIEAYQRSFFALSYVAFPLSLLWLVLVNGNIILLSVFIFIWLNDTGAFIVGSLLGKHKMFPRISPKKSWEGLVGGFIFTIASSVLISHLTADTQPLMLWQWICLAVIVSTAATLGDLVESLLKRTAGVKDSGNIIPGHGGILDRIDSLLLVSPCVVIYLSLI